MLNRVVLVGRLTKDPEIKTTPSGVTVANFTLAVNRPFSNNQGEKEADFIPVVVWRKQAENVNQYLRKGSLAGVDGRMQVRNYEGQDGRKVYVTEVLAESVQFLEPRSGSQQNSSGLVISQGQNSNRSSMTSFNGEPFSSNGQKIDVVEDDLPF